MSSPPLPTTIIAAVREIVTAHQSDPTLSVLRCCHLAQVALSEGLTSVEDWESKVEPYYQQLVLRTRLEKLAEACDGYRGGRVQVSTRDRQDSSAAPAGRRG